jgi:hypothetical protein
MSAIDLPVIGTIRDYNGNIYDYVSFTKDGYHDVLVLVKEIDGKRFYKEETKWYSEDILPHNVTEYGWTEYFQR